MAISIHLAVENDLGLRACVSKGHRPRRRGDNIPLNGGTDGAVNDELGKHTNGTRHTKEDSVVVGLGQAIVLEENTRVGIDVGVGVLGLAVLGEDLGGDLVDLADELEHGVLGHLLLRKGALGRVAGIRLAEDGVAVAGNDTARVESVPEVLGDGLVAEVIANRLLHLREPVEHLLVGEAVEGTGETVEAGGEREEGGAQGAANQVRGVGADVATLVIRVDREVETEELNEVGVLAKAKLVSKVERVVLVLLDGRDLAALEDVLVDAGSDGGELGNEVHRVLESVAPVLLLVDALGVGASERRSLLESGDGERELRHGVEVRRAAVNELLDELGDVGAGGPLGRQVADLLLGRDLARQEEPEEALGEGLLSAGGLGEDLLALGDGLAAEADALLGVEDGALPHEALDATGTAIHLVERDLVDDLGAMLPVRANSRVSLCPRLGSKAP